MATKTPLRILCFGDSLTEGYNNYGLSMDPYSSTMTEFLESKVGGVYEIEVETDGVSGELITRGFEGRMRGWYTEREKQGSFDWVIFLGGTNDLGWGKKPLEIYSAIKSITSLPLENGARVLVMTVPECGVKSESLDRKRDELNGFIKEDGRAGVHIFDLKEKLPYHSLDEEEREEIWDDGLHFSKKGYERLGEMVGECLVGILRSDELK